MTLNITVVSPAGIHQSADFQISKIARDVDGNWIEYQPNSSKIVSVQLQKWSGFLTYCGIGSWNGKRTDEYAAEWLAELPKSGTTFPDVVEKIRKRGTAWIKSINQFLNELMPHSFVLAGYQEGIPVYAIVSNCQSLTKNINPILEELKEDIRSTTDTHVLVTGIRAAVPTENKRKLKRLARSGVDAKVMRYELAKVNRLAANSAIARKGISASCLTYSIDKFGGGHGELHGDVPGPVLPRTVALGVDVTELMSRLFKSSPNVKIIQSGFGTLRSSNEAAKEHIDCDVHFNYAREEPNLPDFATIEEVGEINKCVLSMRHINGNQCVVGQLRFPVAAPPHAFVWPLGREVRDLGTFGGPQSYASSINESCQVVGTADVDRAATHAFLYKESQGMRDLETLGGRDSYARSINSTCQIVGDSFVGTGDPRPEAQRAFLWTRDEGMIDLGKEFEGWSRACAINDAGIVLGWRLRGTVVCGFVWSSELGTIDITGADGRPFYPCAINDTGVVVGEGDDSFGKRRAFSWTREQGLVQLGVTDDFHPCAVDSRGNVLGNVHSRPWSRPYIYNLIRRDFLPLPFVEDHDTEAKAISRNGVIVGEARKASWKHSHPIVWRLSAR